MARTTELEAAMEDRIAAFYDWLSSDYDSMTGFEKRFVHERPFFKLLVENHGIRTALDAGCGTGFHALLLAQLGVEVMAVDLSVKMVEGLKKHARDLGLDVRAVVAGFRELPDVVPGPLDAVFCMGNTLAHLLTAEQLRAALSAFVQVLKPGGILFTQTLNYDRILATREQVQSVKEANGVTFVRSYEYHRDHIRFNILKLERSGSGFRHGVESVDLRPVMHREFVGMLEEAGCEVRAFGGVAMEAFSPAESKDLVVLAAKRQP